MTPGSPPRSPVAAEGRPPGAALIVRRDASTRFLGVAAAALFAGGAASHLILAGAGPGFLVLGALSLLALVNLATAWGDRLILDDDGIEKRNPLLLRLGIRPRRLAWREIAEVREHRVPAAGRAAAAPRALLLVPRSGRRMVLDSLDRFDDVIRTVAERAARDQ
jgi:hypothetical protein